MSVLWTCRGLTVFTRPWIFLGLTIRCTDPGCVLGPRQAGCGGRGGSFPWCGERPEARAAWREPGGPVRTLCSAAVRTQAEPLDAGPGRGWHVLSLCPVPSAFPWCWFVRVCLPWLLGLAAGSFPWVSLLWKVWEALVAPGPCFLPGHGLGLHVTWSSGHTPSPGGALLPRSHPVPSRELD